MKKTMLASFLVLVANGALAEGVTVEMCERMGRIAQNIMTMRQYETPMSKQMRSFTERYANDEYWRLVTTEMVKMAYKIPAYSTKAVQEKEVSRFRNDTESACYENVEL